MDGLVFLIPCAVGLGILALSGFFWALRSGQYDDLEGDGQRVLLNDEPPGPRNDSKPGAS